MALKIELLFNYKKKLMFKICNTPFYRNNHTKTRFSSYFIYLDLRSKEFLLEKVILNPKLD